MINREIFEKDPATNRLLNNGVAKVTSDQSESELGTLRYEITNFVCDGQYADGLGRILNSYLTALDKSEQPGIWVSGFFGSGKSHLVKMLQNLWMDFEFPDGAKARGLAKLPTSITDQLIELSTRAKRAGGLHAAAGALGTGAHESIRLELLRVIFASADLPVEYAQACYVMWLRQEGLEESVKQYVAKTGQDFAEQLNHLHVSNILAKAILAARPDFANSAADVMNLIATQFPPEKPEISIDEMISKIKQAVARGGKLPCTLVVLDEVQQYIGEDGERSKAVQDLQEQCCSRLGANFLFVGTGQSALSGTPLLQRLQGRFPVTVELQDTDVEQVTREIVLKKKPSAVPKIQKLLEDHSGEIERQLANTKIAFASRDRDLLAQDYPILPVRRRFWERVIRAVDKAGTGAQLRTQLWIVYDAAKQTADLPIGNVVGGAFLFEHIKTRVLQSGVLLQEISENIARQLKETDGKLRYDLCALIFLIGQLPHEGPLAAGIKADAESLADLLVTNLNESSADLRKKILQILANLVASGVIMQVEDEYRMQTREGMEWDQLFREAYNKILGDPGKLGGERSQLLKSHCSEALKRFKLQHGISKESRSIEVHFGQEPPKEGGGAIPVWIRDGWEVDRKTVLEDARTKGHNAAVVYGFIPKERANDLQQAIARHYAAATTLQSRGTPTTDEGREARKAMETRLDQAERSRNGIVDEILNGSEIFIAGGDSVEGLLLNEKILDATRDCLDRLYPQFQVADLPATDWKKVIDRAKKGDGDALAAVSHKGDPDSHPVSKAILDFVGSGKKGTEVRKQFGAPPYGWPQDAIDAALIVLSDGGYLKARSGNEPVPKGKLDQKNLTVTEFRVETITLSKIQLIELRKLFKELGLNTQPGQESNHASEYLNRMRSLAHDAGGDAPLPKSPSAPHLDDLAHRIGNDQLMAIFEKRDELAKESAVWRKAKELIEQRLPAWEKLRRLLDHATSLPVAAEVGPEVEAIETGRRLLEDPDPTPGMIEKVVSALRAALNEEYAACAALHTDGTKTLTASPLWDQLKDAQRSQITADFELDPIPPISVGSPDEILDTLRQRRLKEWRTLRDALPTRFGQAAAAAAKLLEPKAQHITLPKATIRNEAELKAWLESVEKEIAPKLKDGPVIL